MAIMSRRRINHLQWLFIVANWSYQGYAGGSKTHRAHIPDVSNYAISQYLCEAGTEFETVPPRGSTEARANVSMNFVNGPPPNVITSPAPRAVSSEGASGAISQGHGRKGAR